MIDRRNLVVVFLAFLLGLMAWSKIDQPAAPTGKIFYMTLPAPTRSIGALPQPTITPTRAPTATPTMKICKVYMGAWVGPCE